MEHDKDNNTILYSADIGFGPPLVAIAQGKVEGIGKVVSMLVIDADVLQPMYRSKYYINPNIGIPYLFTILVLKFEQVHFTTCQCIEKSAGQVAKVQNLIRCSILQCLILVYTVCSGLSV